MSQIFQSSFPANVKSAMPFTSILDTAEDDGIFAVSAFHASTSVAKAPIGAKSAIVMVWGGGGNPYGNSGAQTQPIGTGGASGGFAMGEIVVSSGQTLPTITVGIEQGTSSYGALLTATGANAGTPGTGATSSAVSNPVVYSGVGSLSLGGASASGWWGQGKSANGICGATIFSGGQNSFNGGIHNRNIGGFLLEQQNITNGGVSAIETVSNIMALTATANTFSTADVGAGEILSIERFYRAGLPDSLLDIDVAGFFGILSQDATYTISTGKVDGYGGSGGIYIHSGGAARILANSKTGNAGLFSSAGAISVVGSLAYNTKVGASGIFAGGSGIFAANSSQNLQGGMAGIGAGGGGIGGGSGVNLYGGRGGRGLVLIFWRKF